MSISLKRPNEGILSLGEGKWYHSSDYYVSKITLHVRICIYRPASREKLTTSEQLQIDSEQDGTIVGEEKSEEKRIKDEEWALYTEEHPKGSGNTMNRG